MSIFQSIDLTTELPQPPPKATRPTHKRATHMLFNLPCTRCEPFLCAVHTDGGRCACASWDLPPACFIAAIHRGRWVPWATRGAGALTWLSIASVARSCALHSGSMPALLVWMLAPHCSCLCHSTTAACMVMHRPLVDKCSSNAGGVELAQVLLESCGECVGASSIQGVMVTLPCRQHRALDEQPPERVTRDACHLGIVDEAIFLCLENQAVALKCRPHRLEALGVQI